jgi:transcriptional regulator with XRE-family HTH domain
VDKVNSKLGKVISGLRLSAGLSQEELAERASIHRTYVSQIERGLKSPTIAVLLKLSKALETTPSKIMQLFENEIGVV